MILISRFPKPQGWAIVAALFALVLFGFALYFLLCTIGIEIPAHGPSQYDERPASPAYSGNPAAQPYE